MKRGSRLNREIDRLVGIPLVVVSGLFRRKRLPAPSPRRIALFSATALGDTFLLAGITRDIRIKMPESAIIMLCGETSRGAGELLPDVDEVLTIPITKPRESLRRLGEMPSFDILIDFAPGKRTLKQLARFIKSVDLVISVNTGIMHLAAVSGVPTISLNGPTADHRWGPRGKYTLSVNPACEGCGYLNFGFEFDGQRTDCMDHISPNRVLEAAHAMLRIEHRQSQSITDQS